MDKKEIIKVLEQHFEAKAKYMGVPTFAYQIQTGDEIYTITREGIIEDAGGRQIDLDSIIASNNSANTETDISDAVQGFYAVEISLPLAGHTGTSLRNLVNMIFSKQTMIQKALNIEEMLIDEGLVTLLNKNKLESKEDFNALLLEAGRDKCIGISFDFEQELITFKFRITSAEQIKAVSDLLALINENAKTQKHASSKPGQTDNEKYAFRTWLIRLGMIGDEYKATRKTLLANLEGNGAFRGGRIN